MERYATHLKTNAEVVPIPACLSHQVLVQETFVVPAFVMYELKWVPSISNRLCASTDML